MRSLSIVKLTGCFVFAALMLGGASVPADEAKLADALKALDSNVMSEEERKSARDSIWDSIQKRKHEVNDRSRADWAKIDSREKWEALRDDRYAKLRASLGTFPEPPNPLPVEMMSVYEGNAFRIQNLLYESRPGQWVPANLYVPDVKQPKPRSQPGILIAHSHHRDKWQGELQDMGMTWAREGCQVLVIDQFGYGERRAHPFNSQDDYKGDFKSWRQDYYFRYDSGIQLQLAGDSLMGWMTWDLSRGVDLLLSHPEIDPNKIIILGAVAGGGDPAGVTAALDSRIKACVPFNFGGAQPETRFPLPEDAEASFNYLGGTYWESTRGLRRGGVDGFLHWIIVAGTAPRPLIHAHEFAWDRERDPIWKRYQRIFGEFYGKPDNLSVTHGSGSVKGRPPESTHCTNIGRHHRKAIHPAFKKWFGIDVTEETEYSKRVKNEVLTTVNDEARAKLKMKGPVQLMQELGRERRDAARTKLASIANSTKRLERVRSLWSELLWADAPTNAPSEAEGEHANINGIRVSKLKLHRQTEGESWIPVLILHTSAKQPRGLVIGLAQSGKAGFLKHRSQQISQLLKQGYTVCLPDVRGTGEIKAGDSRDRSSGDGNRSVHLLLFGDTILGQRVQDVQTVLRFVKDLAVVGGKGNVILWGDSFTNPNPAETDFDVPRDVGRRPTQPEPLGGLLATFTALYSTNDVHSLYINRGLTEFASALDSPHVLLPHDTVVPWALRAGDLMDVLAAIGKPVHLANMTDALNRSVSDEKVQSLVKAASGDTDHIRVDSKTFLSLD